MRVTVLVGRLGVGILGSMRRNRHRQRRRRVDGFDRRESSSGGCVRRRDGRNWPSAAGVGVGFGVARGSGKAGSVATLTTCSCFQLRTGHVGRLRRRRHRREHRGRLRAALLGDLAQHARRPAVGRPRSKSAAMMAPPIRDQRGAGPAATHGRPSSAARRMPAASSGNRLTKKPPVPISNPPKFSNRGTTSISQCRALGPRIARSRLHDDVERHLFAERCGKPLRWPRPPPGPRSAARRPGLRKSAPRARPARCEPRTPCATRRARTQRHRPSER